MRSSTTKTLFLILPPLLLVGAWFVMNWVGDGGGADDGGEVVALGPGRAPLVEDEPLVTDPGTIDLVGPTERSSSKPRTGDTTVGHPLEVHLTLVQAGTVAEAEGVLPQGSGADARLRGLIRGTNGQPTRATITVLFGPNQGRTLHTNAQGQFGTDDLYAGRAVVEVRTSTGLRARRDVILRRLAEQQLNVNFAGPAVVYGTVIDKAGEPIANAEVTLDGNVVYTNQDGVFHIPRVASGLHVVATVEATGYALHRESLSLERNKAYKADQIKFRLEPEATLEVAVTSSPGVFQDVQVHLYPAAGAGLHDFPWELVSPVTLKPGTQKTVRGLRRGTFVAVPFHVGAVALPRQHSVRVEPTRQNLLKIDFGAAPTVHGVVLRDGAPVAGAVVTMEAPDLASATTKALMQKPRFLEQVLLPHVGAARQETRTNAQGEFRLTAHDAGGSTHYLSAASPDGSWVGSAIARFGDPPLTIEVAEVAAQVGSLQLDLPERWQALPVQVVRAGQPDDPRVLESDEQLVIDQLTAGQWRVSANWRGSRVLEAQPIQITTGGLVELTGRLPRAAIDGQ